jgi:hypothetical protein
VRYPPGIQGSQSRQITLRTIHGVRASQFSFSMDTSFNPALCLFCNLVASARGRAFRICAVHPFIRPCRSKLGSAVSGVGGIVLTTTLDKTPTERAAEMRMKALLVLDFPVLIAQLPYILVSPSKREWIPKEMSPRVWRAQPGPSPGQSFGGCPAEAWRRCGWLVAQWCIRE